MNEYVDSSKTVVTLKASDITQGNGSENDDDHTPCSKPVGKRSAEKAVSELTVYELDGDESATTRQAEMCQG